MEATYKVDGMTCGGCTGSVQRAVSAALPGVQVEVSLERGEVHIAGAHEAAAVKAAVEEAGFDFTDPNAA